MESITLNNGITMPMLGFGTFLTGYWPHSAAATA